MAKALFGHAGGPGSRLVSEVHRLKLRVRDLEAEVDRLHEQNDALTAAAARDGTRESRSPAPPARGD